jgi:predicted transcriptional regulator
MDAKGYTQQEIADKFSVTQSTVSEALSKVKALILNPSDIKEYRNKEIDILDSVRCQLVTAIANGDKVQKAPLGTLALAYCQLTDKSLLMQGKSTQNISVQSIVQHLHDQELALRKELDTLPVVSEQHNCEIPESH